MSAAASSRVNVRLASQAAINVLKDNPIYLVIALLVVVTSIVEPKFLTTGNFQNIVRQFGTLIFAALGMTFVIMAGFLESFITRYTEMPVALSLAIIGGSLAFVIYYFIIYPQQLNTRLFDGRDTDY